MTAQVNTPPNTWYRRMSTKVKDVQAINITFKWLNIGRNLEIRKIAQQANINVHDVVCDIGCGDGYWSGWLGNKSKKMIAFDPFWDDLKKASHYRSSKQTLFLQAVGENIPIREATVDKVISACVFEHNFDDHRMFSEIFRILRPGGKLFATVDSLSSPYISDSHRKWHETACYCSQLYTREIITEKLQSVGFQEIETTYLMGSLLAVNWEIMLERFGAAFMLMAPIFYPFIFLFDRKNLDSGYKLFVSAEKK